MRPGYTPIETGWFLAASLFNFGAEGAPNRLKFAFSWVILYKCLTATAFYSDLIGGQHEQSTSKGIPVLPCPSG